MQHGTINLSSSACPYRVDPHLLIPAQAGTRYLRRRTIARRINRDGCQPPAVRAFSICDFVMVHTDEAIK
jgi:hypothetical protein